MLTEKILQQAEHISNAVIYSNKGLSVLANTPINSLVNTLASLIETGTNEQLKQQSCIPGSTTGTHSDVQEYNAQKIAKIMSNIINTAKNIVNPHCRAIIEGIEEQRKNNILVSVGLLGDIKQIDMPAILTDEMFIALIDNYKDTPASVITNTMELFDRISNDFTIEEKNILIKTGSTLLDSRIDELLGSDIGYVGGEGGSSIDVAQLELKTCIAYFLLLTGLQNEKLDKASAIMADDETRLTVAKLRAAIGGKIYRETALFDTAIKNGEIIARDNFLLNYLPNNCLTVYGINYRDWIQNKGGSPEAALGYLALNGNRFSVSADLALRNDPEMFLTEYNNRIQHAKTKNILDDIKLVRDFTRNYMADTISKMEDSNRPVLQRRLQDALEHEYHGATYLESFVIKVVSRTLVDGPDVKDILLEINSILSESEKPEMNYAVFIASIRLVARWITSQITMVSNAEVVY